MNCNISRHNSTIIPCCLPLIHSINTTYKHSKYLCFSLPKLARSIVLSVRWVSPKIKNTGDKAFSKHLVRKSLHMQFTSWGWKHAVSSSLLLSLFQSETFSTSFCQVHPSFRPSFSPPLIISFPIHLNLPTLYPYIALTRQIYLWISRFFRCLSYGFVKIVVTTKNLWWT